MQTFQTQVRTIKNGQFGDTGNTEHETKTTKANQIKTNKASKRKQTNKQIKIQKITQTKSTESLEKMRNKEPPKNNDNKKKGLIEFLARGKQFLSLIIHPPCHPCSDEVLDTTVIYDLCSFMRINVIRLQHIEE
jgi:hypothetical protein